MSRVIPYGSHFGHGNGTLRTNLDTGLATETLINLNRFGLPIFKFENLCGTGIHAFFTTGTFVLINYNFKHDTPPG